MKKFLILFAVVSVFSGSTLVARAQETPQNTADHAALRLMLQNAQTAVNTHNIDGLTQYLDPNVNVIFQNGEVADGVPAVQAFYERMFNGSNPVLKDFSTVASADKLSKIYGDTATAYGTDQDHYTFIGGTTMDLTSKWSATLIKENGSWKVVSLQFTSNIFDNPLLSKATASATYFGIGGLVIGLILGFLLFKILRKKKKY